VFLRHLDSASGTVLAAREVSMDAVYMFLVLALFAASLGLIRLCESVQ
jgi:hypothetical protein